MGYLEVHTKMQWLLKRIITAWKAEPAKTTTTHLSPLEHPDDVADNIFKQKKATHLQVTVSKAEEAGGDEKFLENRL